jgi:hypothetical protein
MRLIVLRYSFLVIIIVYFIYTLYCYNGVVKQENNVYVHEQCLPSISDNVIKSMGNQFTFHDSLYVERKLFTGNAKVLLLKHETQDWMFLKNYSNETCSFFFQDSDYTSCLFRKKFLISESNYNVYDTVCSYYDINNSICDHVSRIDKYMDYLKEGGTLYIRVIVTSQKDIAAIVHEVRKRGYVKNILSQPLWMVCLMHFDLSFSLLKKTLSLSWLNYLNVIIVAEKTK